MSAMQATHRIEAQFETGRISTEDVPASVERLETWKDIAGYLRRNVRTVQRWEKTLGLPIHRVQESKSGSVYACKSEIDNWRRDRAIRIARDRLPLLPVSPELRQPRTMVAMLQIHRWTLIALLVGLVLGAACGQLISSSLQRSASARSLNTSVYVQPTKGNPAVSASTLATSGHYN